MLSDIAVLIDKWEKVTILPHISADGDCLGSSFALGLALKKKGKIVTVYIEEEIPGNLDFLPGGELAVVYTGEPIDPALVITIDSGDIERLGQRHNIFKLADTTVNIDHHATNTHYAKYNYVNTDAAAVGEIIYKLIDLLGIELDIRIAECLYVAITTDTGGFRYSNTTPKTHCIAGSLIKYGVDIAEISARVFERSSYSKVKLMGAAIEKLEILENGRLSVILVTEDMMIAAGANEEDSDGLVNIARNIEGVEVAVLLRQKNSNEVKVNLRSNGDIDVSKIAVKFSGGGHPKAAGCTLIGDFEEVTKQLIAVVKDFLSID